MRPGKVSSPVVILAVLLINMVCSHASWVCIGQEMTRAGVCQQHSSCECSGSR